MIEPPFETQQLRLMLKQFLNQRAEDRPSGRPFTIGNYKFGVYAFFDYDGEPIYVGQTNESLRSRIGRHLTNQRTDAVAMKVLDPYEVRAIEVWPLPQYQRCSRENAKACGHLNWLEYEVYRTLLKRSRFGAVLNEKAPPPVARSAYAKPKGFRGVIVSTEVLGLRGHPDTRIARRAETLSVLTKVVSERQVSKGLRQAVLTQARRLAWLAEQRFGDFKGQAEEK
jgi:hypothetical protein